MGLSQVNSQLNMCESVGIWGFVGWYRLDFLDLGLGLGSGLALRLGLGFRG